MERYQEEHLLANHLRACGHFLYYQTGGKAGQQRILATLIKEENITQKDLQGILEISSGSLSEILQKMEESALVERKKICNDKRQIMITLTPKGVEMACQMKVYYMQMLERMFECLDDIEKKELDQLLEKLVRHLDLIRTNPLFEMGGENSGFIKE